MFHTTSVVNEKCGPVEGCTEKGVVGVGLTREEKGEVYASGGLLTGT